MWKKTTASGKSHGMRTVCKLGWMKNLKAKQASLLNENYNHLNIFQMKDIQLCSESLKSFQVWVIEKSYDCALALCRCKNTAENFDGHVKDFVTVKNIFDKNPISVCLCLLWLPWHQFELDVWSWLLASFKFRDRKYLSIIFISRTSEVTLMALWLVNIQANFGLAQNI